MERKIRELDGSTGVWCTANKQINGGSPFFFFFSSSSFSRTIARPFYFSFGSQSIVLPPNSFDHLWRCALLLRPIMLPDAAHGVSFLPRPHRQFNTLAIDAEDPTKVWIEFLMDHGGFFTLLGVPALCATVVFVGRMRWLQVNRQPHQYGRTAAIYWPTQISICVNSLVLVVLLASLIWSSESIPMQGLAPAIALTLIAWVAVLPLNTLEHKYETRSSDFIFLFLVNSLLLDGFALYILSEDEGQLAGAMSPFRLFSWSLLFAACALFFEAFSRGNTEVQRLGREKENQSEYDQANLCSRLTFHYVQRIVSVGSTRPLTPADLVNTSPPWLETKVNYDLIEEYWSKVEVRLLRERDQDEANGGREGKKDRYRNAFFWAVMRAYGRKIFTMMAFRLTGLGLLYVPPMLFGQLLKFMTDYSSAIEEGVPPPSRKIGLMLTGSMFAFSELSLIILAVAFLSNTDLGIEARAGTIALIYRKALKLSPAARVKSTLGEITNHMAVDAERWVDASIYLPLLISIPLELVISIYLLYQLLGWSLFVGLLVFAILVPLQAKSANFMNSFQEEQLKWMDERLRLMTEILSNIKIVKLYNWEAPFHRKVNFLRAKELKAVKGVATIRAFLSIVFSSVTLLMALCTFSVFSTVGGPNMTPGKLSSEVVFVSITLFGIMNRPLGQIGHMISKVISIMVAMQRIQRYLLLEEIDTTAVQRHSRHDRSPNSTEGTKALAIEIKDATLSWSKLEVVESSEEIERLSERQPLLTQDHPGRLAKPVLSDINLEIEEGKIVAIVGRIGQGKTSLLSSIMGETYKQKGSLAIWGNLAYVPQQAWIINATVRDNIVFGKPFDQIKYDRIIYASGLTPDLEMLTAGDLTEIGEKGINLSGGQKQRVSLARAAYQDADIYLLDDPLSAVDAHVDQHLWQNLIGPEGLLKDKCRVLVTHGIHHLDHVDQIVVLKDGRISETGEYQYLMKERGPFYQLIKEYSVNRRKKKRTTSAESHKALSKDDLQAKLGSLERVKGYGATNDSTASSDIESAVASDGEDTSERETIVGETSKAGDDNTGELIADEKMEEGKVGWNVLMTYARAASFKKAMLCILLFAVAQVFHMSTNFWLRYWISDSQEREKNGEEARPVSYYLIGYGRLVLLYIVFDLFSNYTTEVVCGIQASKVLYDRLMTRILRLPMSFFDVTPTGRIVNRFSSDINAIDSSLPAEWNDLFAFAVIICGTLFVISYSTPMFLIIVPLLFLIYLWIQDYFIKSSQSLKRMYSVSRSPLYQHFSETLAGASSIRVIDGLKDRFVRLNDERADTIANRMNSWANNNRWLQIRLETLGAFTVFVAASLAVMNAENLDPSLVGLALSYALNMIAYSNYLVRTVCEVANVLVCVERVDEYSNKPEEAPEATGVRLPPNWPQRGQVVFKNYSTRYREGLDLVLKDVSFTVHPMQKTGIVGRTGAGKSSLTLALFRIVEAADSFWAKASDPSAEDQSNRAKYNNSVSEPLFTESDIGGSIEIDGIDISTLGLSDLRRHLSIIPQDPTLFAGTVRGNLDPFEERTDHELWEALERAHLKEHIVSLPGGLSFEVAQNGENFSVGQRSLICLSRALLRKTKVLILDEATAAVDVETDGLIQKTIRKEFQDRTILTIAHRIKTVMDSDKILVLEKGRVCEYETPQELLRRKDSLFYRLAEQAGEVDDPNHPRVFEPSSL